MAKTVEIPDELHDALADRAQKEGVTLPAFVERELRELVESGRAKDALLERIRSRSAVDLGISAADLIREGREERDRELSDRWLSSTPRQ